MGQYSTADDINRAVSAAELSIYGKIEAASRVLRASFEPAMAAYGSESIPGGDPIQIILSAANSYSKDLKENTSSFDTFKGILSSIQGLRSTYLPIEYLAAAGLANTAGIAGFSAELTSVEIAEQQANFESYENAFMRMLGMPGSGDLDVSKEILRITPDGQLKAVTLATMSDYVLTTRQLDPQSRPYVVLDDYFSFSVVKVLDRLSEEQLAEYEKAKKEWDSYKDELTGVSPGSGIDGLYPSPVPSGEEELNTMLKARWMLLAKGEADPSFSLIDAGITEQLITDLYREEMLGKVGDATVAGITNPSNFFRMSYLLTPPVQDSIIVGCINEPSKIVAKNFSPYSLRKINNQTAKSSFLEAVIRLRLDKISGVDPATLNSEEGPPVPTTIGGVEVKTFEDTQKGGTYGILEALIVARLEAAVGGMARYIRDNVKNMQINAQRSRVTTRSDRQGPPRESPNQANQWQDFSSNFFPSIADGTNAAASERKLFATIVAVEDAINLFFADESEPYEITKGTQRGSTLRKAHLMNAIVSIVGQPGEVARARLSELDEERERRAKKGADLYQTNISTVIGNVNGIGIIDVAIFLLSLFLIDEKHLLGMLTVEELENMTSAYPTDFFKALGETGVPQIEESLNAFTLILYANYNKFIGSINKTKAFYYGGRIVGG